MAVVESLALITVPLCDYFLVSLSLNSETLYYAS